MNVTYCIESKIYYPALPISFIESKKTESHDWNHYLSRKALSGALETINETFAPENIKISNHLCIEKREDLLVSLSHTKGHAVGMASNDESIKSIGVDVELREREIKEGVEKFFLNKFDQEKLQYDTLLLWSLKEAAFKALSPFADNFQEKVLVLKDIWIRDGNFGLISEPNESLGFIDFAHELHGDELLLISFAILLKENT